MYDSLCRVCPLVRIYQHQKVDWKLEMNKLGTLENGELLYALTEDDVARLERREGVRKNQARCDATFASIANDIESIYNLPSGCLRVLKPGSTDAYRRDVLIRTLRSDYGM